MADKQHPIIASYLVKVHVRSSDPEATVPTLDEIKATVSVSIAEMIDAAAVVSAEAERVDK
jgi:hypothetical protein